MADPCKYSAKECLDAFCARMMEKAKALNMNLSTFVDPAGVDNYSTAHDIMRLLIAAMQNKALRSIMSADNYAINIDGDNARDFQFASYTRQGEYSHVLGDRYEIIGGKGGSLYTPHIFNQATVVKAPPCGEVACVIMKSIDANDGPKNRYEATAQAVDAALMACRGEDDTKGCKVCAQCAYVCTMPDENQASRVLYEKDIDTVIKPASMSKMLTALVILENLPDLNVKFTLTQEILDILPKPFYVKDFLVGDTASVFDLLHALMLVSSNCAAFILGCNVGAMFLDAESK